MTETDIRSGVARYLAGICTVEQLEQALPDGWELDEANDAHLRDLALRVMGHIAEHSAADIGDDELRQRLTPDAAWIITTSSSFSSASARVSRSLETEVSRAGKQFRVVPA
jgi:hypothetical protein